MWDPAKYMKCRFCDSKTNGQSFGREASYLCVCCYGEWQEQFRSVDPCDLKRRKCPECSGLGSLIVAFNGTENGNVPVFRTCTRCEGFGWLFAKKSPLEHLAEAGMEE